MSTKKQDEEPEEHKCPEGEVWSEDEGKCIAKSAPPEAEKGLTERIFSVIEDALNKKLEAFEKKIDEKIDTILKTKEVEVEKALRKGFGLEQDPVVHMSELISYGRKLALEKGESDKRTPGKEGGGPEGATAEPTGVDAIFKATEEQLKARGKS